MLCLRSTILACHSGVALAFMVNILHRFTLTRWQISLSGTGAAAVAIAALHSTAIGTDVGILDKATYISYLATTASILTLFCSISIAFVLFISQSIRAERVTAYDILKARLLEAQKWLLSETQSPDTEICLSLVFEFDKWRLEDLPQTQRPHEYVTYNNKLNLALACNDEKRRLFYLKTTIHFAYVEDLLRRIGLLAIRLIVTKAFIDSLAKGVSIVSASLVTLVGATVLYSPRTKVAFVYVAAFYSLFKVLLLFEFCYDLYREYKEQLDFVESAHQHES